MERRKESSPNFKLRFYSKNTLEHISQQVWIKNMSVEEISTNQIPSNVKE